MKRMVILLLLTVCQLSLWGDEMSCQTMFVFVSPIEEEKTNLLKESQFLNSEEQALFFQSLGISTYCRWIQKIQDHDFLMHLLKGDDLMNSFAFLKNKIEQNDEAAIHLNQIY